MAVIATTNYGYILHGFHDAKFYIDVDFKTLSEGAQSINNNDDYLLYVNVVTGSVQTVPDDLTNQLIINASNDFQRANALVMIDSDGTSNLYANCCEILDYYTMPMYRNFYVGFDTLSGSGTAYFFDSDDDEQQKLFYNVYHGG